MRRNGQAGFTLAGLIAILGVIMVFITATVPKQWSKVMARERDAQTIHIMKQYARAIRNFQTKNGALPVSMQQLREARSPRMIRGSAEMLDPLTGADDWILVPATALQGRQVTPPGIPPPRNAPRNPTPQPQPLPNTPGQTVGPFVGVRPNMTGPSFLTLNGAENYEEWLYTIQDLQAEIDARRNSLLTK